MPVSGSPTGFLVAGSHNRTLSSTLADASRVPSGLNATDQTPLVWPVSGSPTGYLVAGSHNRTVSSSLADASRVPSALNATDNTELVWPMSGSPTGSPAPRRAGHRRGKSDAGLLSRWRPRSLGDPCLSRVGRGASMFWRDGSGQAGGGELGWLPVVVESKDLGSGLEGGVDAMDRREIRAAVHHCHAQDVQPGQRIETRHDSGIVKSVSRGVGTGPVLIWFTDEWAEATHAAVLVAVIESGPC